MAWSPRIMGDTRRERDQKVARTFGPLYALAGQLRADAVDSIRGEPVLKAWGEYMSAAHTLDSFGRCFARISPDFDADAFDRVAKRLDKGVPLEVADVDRLVLALRKAEAIYRVTPLSVLRSALNTQMIADEIEAIKESGVV